MSRRISLSLALLIPLFAPPLALSEEPPWHFGTELDLLPFLSDGYSVSAFAGRGRFRGRLVRAELTTPDFVTDDDFRDNELAIVALVFDLFLREEHKGWWLGVGLESWDGTVTEKASGIDHPYDTTVLTAGAGYVWQLGGHFTINPWAGDHTPVGGDRAIQFSSHEFSLATTPEASLKVGVSF